MGLWGTAHASAENKPKNYPTDENADYKKQDIFANQSGWVQKAGTAASGNDNASAQEEVLIAIGDLAGSTDTTGLRAPTITHIRFIKGTTASTDISANDGGAQLTVEVTYDEEVTVAGTPQFTVDNGNQSSAGQGDYTLDYDSSNSDANRLQFTKTSLSLSVGDVLTIGGHNISLNSGTISDTVRGGTNLAASLVMSGLTAVTETVVA